MAEDGLPGPDTVDVTDTTAPTTPAPEAPTYLADADGKFIEGWQATLPEELRGDATLARFNNIPDMAKSLVSTKKLVGKNTIAALNENSTDEEKAEFWTAAGRPETADDYNLQKPENLPDALWSSEYATHMQEVAHGLGLSTEQFAGLAAAHNDNVVSQYTTQSQNVELEQIEGQKALRQEWGPSFDANIHIANAAVEKGVRGDEEFKTRVLGKFGADHDFQKFVSQLGSEFVESGVKIVPNAPTASLVDIDARIEEHMKSEAFTTRTHKGHQAALDQMSRLFEQKYKLQAG